MGRITLGIVAGVIAAFATIMLLEYGLHFLLVDAAPALTGNGSVETMALGLKLAVVLCWFVGALAGAFFASRIARRSAISWVPAALVAVAGSPTS